jgi:hypothetical protein
MDSTEPREPIDSRESVDHSDRREEPVEDMSGLCGTAVVHATIRTCRRVCRAGLRRVVMGGSSAWLALRAHSCREEGAVVTADMGQGVER